jgi:hypothetical protein
MLEEIGREGGEREGRERDREREKGPERGCVPVKEVGHRGVCVRMCRRVSLNGELAPVCFDGGGCTELVIFLGLPCLTSLKSITARNKGSLL